MYPVMLVIQPKEGITAAGVAPAMPTADEVAGQLSELLAKATARHALLGFTVTEVTFE